MMYKIVSIERLGDSVFRNEYEYLESKDAKNKYNEEKNNPNVVDVKLWYCVEIERFCRDKSSKEKSNR